MLNKKSATEREPINLARIAPFRLGAMEVSPATLLIKRGEQSEPLEPRVMQVLVALCQAKGAVVTREEMTCRCWGGRIVGDNALQRTISRIRDIAAGIGEGCFRLETVNKVGYQLIPLKGRSAEETIAPRGARFKFRSWQGAMGVAAAAAASIATLVAWPQASSTTISITADRGNASGQLAEGLAVDLARLANLQGNTLLFVSGADSVRPDYLLKISREDSAGGPRADVTLLKYGSADVLWSASFAAHNVDPTILRPQIANAVFRVTGCALQTNNGASRPDRQALRLVFSGCERLDGEHDNTVVEMWRKIVARDARNARALATLALLEAEWAEFGSKIAALTAQQSASLRSSATDDFHKARDMDSSLGLTYLAESFLIARWRYADQFALLERGIAADPDCADLYELKSVELARVGRMDDAVYNARKAAELEPSSPFHRALLAQELAYDGYTQGARAELESAERIWPDEQTVRDARGNFDYRFGDPKTLLREIDGGSMLQRFTSVNMQKGIMRTFLLARSNPSPQNVEQAAKLAFAFRYPYATLQNLVGLGRVEMAYEYLRKSNYTVAQFRNGDTDVLFRVTMRPFIFDRRFMAFADRVGLLRYWQSSGNWPDFCADRDIPYNCRAETDRLHVAG